MGVIAKAVGVFLIELIQQIFSREPDSEALVWSYVYSTPYGCFKEMIGFGRGGNQFLRGLKASLLGNKGMSYTRLKTLKNTSGSTFPQQ